MRKKGYLIDRQNRESGLGSHTKSRGLCSEDIVNLGLLGVQESIVFALPFFVSGGYIAYKEYVTSTSTPARGSVW